MKKVMVIGIICGIILGIIIKVFFTPVVETVHAEIIVEPEVVIVEVVYDWNQENIEKYIKSVFVEEPEKAVRVAMCEGTVKGKLDPKVVNPTNNSNDTGVFQVSMKYHGVEVARQGLDMTNVIDNVNYAYQLYKKNGWEDWKWSKHCWNK